MYRFRRAGGVRGSPTVRAYRNVEPPFLRGHHAVPYTDSGMASSAEATLDHVVEILEQLNMHDRVEVPKAVTATLVALGFEGTVGLSPSELLPRVLDKQRLFRRRAAAARVKIAL